VSSTLQQEKITANPSNPVNSSVIEKISYDYDKAISWIQTQGKSQFGNYFEISQNDIPLLRKVLSYFFKDLETATALGIHLNKGILLSGPIGCGKTSLMFLVRHFMPQPNQYIVKSCRDISFEFIKEGYTTIQKYSHSSFKNHEPITYCFDDLGTENNLKFYGNECNIMAEILLSRYDLFVSRKLITHLTTNLSASEIEASYGNRLRSRLREQFNLIAFNSETKDKRK
jgi:predicted ATPase